MSGALPPPPVPPDADLRGMDFMPLKGERLFNSVTWLEASYEGRCAALRTWWHAFSKEVPAGSLPDNDRLLASYAGYGESVKAWAKIRTQAMRGWYKCSDGRLYHKVVAEIVVEAWDKRLDYRGEQEARAERQRRWRERLKKLSAALREKGVAVPRGAKMETLERLCSDAGVDVSIIESDGDVDIYRDAGEIGKTGTGKRQGQGQGQGKEVRVGGRGDAPPAQPPTQVPQDFADNARKMGEGWAKPLPEGWDPSDADRAHVAEMRPDLSADAIRLESAKFVADAHSKAKTSHDWGQSWRRWVISTFTTSLSATETRDQQRIRKAKEAIR